MSKRDPERPTSRNPHCPPPRATGAWGQRCQVTRLFQRKPLIKILRELAPLQKRKCVCKATSTGGIPRFPSTMVSGLTLWAPERRLLCPRPGQTLLLAGLGGSHPNSQRTGAGKLIKPKPAKREKTLSGRCCSFTLSSASKDSVFLMPGTQQALRDKEFFCFFVFPKGNTQGGPRSRAEPLRWSQEAQPRKTARLKQEGRSMG